MPRPSFALRTTIVCVGVSVGACSNPAFPTHAVELELQTDTVWINRSPNEVRIAVPIVVRNRDSRPLYVTPCGHVLQVATDDQWIGVWSDGCPSGRLLSLELSPGESTLLTLGTRISVTSDAWPATASAGTYRAILALTVVPLNIGGVTPTPVATAARITAPFPVRVRTIVF